VLKDDGHMSDPETLSSYQFALSMRSSAPRIEAHYQYYHTAVEPSLKAEEDTACPVWVLFNGKQYCSPTLDEAHGEISGSRYVRCESDSLKFQELTFIQPDAGPTVRPDFRKSFGTGFDIIHRYNVSYFWTIS
jgi:hypothetical protein